MAAASNAFGTAPVSREEPVTPGTAFEGGDARALYLDTPGSITYELAGEAGVQHTKDNLAPGVWHPMQISRVVSSDATGIFVGR